MSMEVILFGIVALLVLCTVWFFIRYQRDVREDEKIFDEYLENQRKIKYNKIGRGVRQSKKRKSLI